jgi:hypothetical protein
VTAYDKVDVTKVCHTLADRERLGAQCVRMTLQNPLPSESGDATNCVYEEVTMRIKYTYYEAEDIYMIYWQVCFRETFSKILH